MTTTELAASVSEGYKQFIEREERRRPKPHPTVYASAWSPCTRQMFYDSYIPEVKPDLDTYTLANFRRGKDRERDLKADLDQAGRNSTPPFELVGSEERFEIRDHKGRVAISGKVDAQVAINGQKVPLEIKSWGQHLTAKVKTFDDLLEGRFTRRGAFQCLIYLLLTEQPLGFMLLDRHGLPLLLPVELESHLELAEDFLARAERVMDALNVLTTGALVHGTTDKDALLAACKDSLPPYHDDPGECKNCGYFGRVCSPPLTFEGAAIVDDPETIAALERREELREAGKEYESLDKELKERFRGLPQAICGKFLVQGKSGKLTKVVFPDEATKRKYQVTDPEGKWIVTITKVDQ
jgi:hypothetical protein